jgi:hypothetical protein
MDNYDTKIEAGIDWQAFMFGCWWDSGEFGVNFGPFYFTLEWVYIGPTPTGTA